MRRKTDTQFKKEVYDLVGNEYVFLDSYVNALTRLKVKHNKCGNVYDVIPNNFIKGRRCPYCSGNVKKTNTQFKQEVFNLVGSEYTFLESYVGANNKLRVKHNQCGKIYEVTPYHFISGGRCPNCVLKDKRKTNEQFKQEVFNLVGNEYTFLEPYVTGTKKIKIRHNECNNVYLVAPVTFLNGSYCPYCSKNARKTDAQFKQEVYDLVGNEYVFLEHYVNCYTKIKVKHNKCGNIYRVTPNHFLRGILCPYCNSPKGELIIDKILKSLKINYEAQKMFDDLKDKYYLSYDFYIPGQNILIEYQGIQHYQPIDYFGGVNKFVIQQKHDQMKLDYAKNHGYNLITVPYTEDTLSKIKKYLFKHGFK